MARNYAQFTTAIWRPGDDFGRLTRNAQWVYFMLATQPDISAAGTLSLNVRRWAGRSADGSKQDIIDGLQELSTHRFAFYDYDTEEVLLRAFIKSDGGYTNQKRKPVIERAVKDVESQALRKVLADELAKVGLPPEWASDSPSDAHRMAYPPDSDEPPTRTPNASFSQVDRLSDSLSGQVSDGACRSDGVVVTKALVVVPQPSTLNPQPVPPPAAAAAAPAAQTTFPGMPAAEIAAVVETDDRRAFRLARAWIKHRADTGTPVPPRGKGDIALKLKTLLVGYLTAQYTEDEINEALKRCDKGIPSGQHLDDALKEIRREADPNYQGPAGKALSRRPTPEQPRRSTSALRAEQALALAAELDREHAHLNGVAR